MKGKDKCKILKDIRQRIADENDIEFVTKECEYHGDCRGTCPRCEAELRYLEEQLERKRKLGQGIAAVALSATMLVASSACIDDTVAGAEAEVDSEVEQLEGDIAYYEEIEGDIDVDVMEGEPAEYYEDEIMRDETVMPEVMHVE